MCSWWSSFDNCTISNCDIPPDAGQCDMLMVVCVEPFDRLLKRHVNGYRECRVLFKCYLEKEDVFIVGNVVSPMA